MENRKQENPRQLLAELEVKFSEVYAGVNVPGVEVTEFFVTFSYVAEGHSQVDVIELTNLDEIRKLNKRLILYIKQAENLAALKERFKTLLPENGFPAIRLSSDLDCITFAYLNGDGITETERYIFSDKDDIDELEDKLNRIHDTPRIAAEINKHYKIVLPNSVSGYPQLRPSSIAGALTLEFINLDRTVGAMRYLVHKTDDLERLFNYLACIYARPAVLVPDPAVVGKIKNLLAEKKNGRYEKDQPPLAELNLDYSICKWGDQYYAIDKGDKFNNLIGKGTYGTVKRVQNIENPNAQIPREEAILKIQKILPGEDKNAAIARVKKELEIVRFLQGKTDEIDVIVRKNYSGQEQIEFIMPLVRGVELHDFLHKRRPAPTFAQCFGVARSILDGFAFINRKGVFHCDISTSNILVDEKTDKAGYIDFGVAGIVSQDNRSLSHDYVVTTHDFAAPEFIDETSSKNFTTYKKDVTYTDQTEIYSLGVLLAKVLLPGEISQAKDRLADGVACTYKHMQEKSKNPSYYNRIINLINKMMDKDPTKRPLIKAVLQEFAAIEAMYLLHQKKPRKDNDVTVVTASSSGLVRESSLPAATEPQSSVSATQKSAYSATSPVLFTAANLNQEVTDTRMTTPSSTASAETPPPSPAK